jgi:hypothetical protein
MKENTIEKDWEVDEMDVGAQSLDTPGERELAHIFGRNALRPYIPFFLISR